MYLIPIIVRISEYLRPNHKKLKILLGLLGIGGIPSFREKEKIITNL